MAPAGRPIRGWNHRFGQLPYRWRIHYRARHCLANQPQSALFICVRGGGKLQEESRGSALGFSELRSRRIEVSPWGGIFCVLLVSADHPPAADFRTHRASFSGREHHFTMQGGFPLQLSGLSPAKLVAFGCIWPAMGIGMQSRQVGNHVSCACCKLQPTSSFIFVKTAPKTVHLAP